MRKLWESIEDRSKGAWWRGFARSWVRGGLALLLLCAAVYIPGQTSLPPVDRDECRFAQASRQMFESVALPEAQRDAKMHAGGLVVPMLVDVPRLNKPPLVYWLQSASAALFTWGKPLEDAIWMYRVPSALCALVSVFATWRLGLKMLDCRAALLGAILLAVAPMVVWDAHQARADQLLLACTTVCMGALWTVWKARSSAQHGAWGRAFQPAAFVFWFALAAGIMAKGPVTPLVAGLAIVWLSLTTRSWRWTLALRPGWGLVIVGACVAPWVWAVAQRQGGLGAYAALVWDEFFARGLRGSREGHFAPPGTHTLLLAALFWPGSLLTLAGFIAAWKRARGETAAAANMQPDRQGARAGVMGALRTPWHGRDAEMFLIAWIVPMWIVFELSMAKLPHYTMPMYPAIALVSARMVMRAAAARAIFGHASTFAWGLIGCLTCGFTLVMARFWVSAAWLQEPGTGLIGLRITVLLMALGAVWLGGLLCAVCLCNRGWWAAGQVGAALLAVPLGAATISLIVPRVVPGADTAAIVQAAAVAGSGRTLATAVPSPEASMVFATRGRRVHASDAANGMPTAAATRWTVLLDADGLNAARAAGWRVSGVGRTAKGSPVWVAVPP